MPPSRFFYRDAAVPEPTQPLSLGVVALIEREGTLLLERRVDSGRWGLVGGAVEMNDSLEAALRREVLEETGLRCALVRELESTHYTDGKGRPKIVRYWLMQVEGGRFAPNDEVDELRWLTPDEAVDLLTYDRDRELVAGSAL